MISIAVFSGWEITRDDGGRWDGAGCLVLRQFSYRSCGEGEMSCIGFVGWGVHAGWEDGIDGIGDGRCGCDGFYRRFVCGGGWNGIGTC